MGTILLLIIIWLGLALILSLVLFRRGGYDIFFCRRIQVAVGAKNRLPKS